MLTVEDIYVKYIYLVKIGVRFNCTGLPKVL